MILKKITLIAFSFILVTTPFYASAANIKGKLKDVRNKQIKIQDKIDKANSKAEESLKEIRKEEAKIDKVIEDMAPIQKRYLKAEKELAKVKEILTTRLQELYIKGETNILSKLAAANSLSDFLGIFEVIRILIHNDHQLYLTYEKAVEESKQSKKAYDDKITLIQKEIDKIKTARNKVLGDVSSDKKQLQTLHLFEMDHRDELIQINLDELKSGTLNFAYTGPFARPVAKSVLTSGFGYRSCPRPQHHNGIDFAAPIGTPVIAPADGVVVSSKPSGGYGWLITIYHGNKDGKRIYTRYAHSYPNQVRVNVGQQVKKGDHITSVGQNGDATGPHLHFEVLVGSGNKPPFVNPASWLANR